MPQPKSLTLRQNFSWTFVGNIIYAASQWGMLVVLAKLGSPEMVGQFTLGLAVTAPIILFANLQLRQIQTTDVDRKYQFGDYLGLRLICAGLSMLAIVSILLTAGYQWETSLTILIIGIAKAIESISDIFQGLLQYQERMDRIAISLAIKGPLSLLMLAIGIWLTGSVWGGSIGLAVVWAGVLLFYDIPCSLEVRQQSESSTDESIDSNQLFRPRFNFVDLRNLVKLALPLGIVMMLLSLNVNIPRYFIEHHLGSYQLGIFSALSYLMVAGNVVVGALGQSVSPRLAKYYAAGNYQDFQSLLFKTLLIGVLLGGLSVLVAAIAGKQILTILYRPEYAEQGSLFLLLMIAAGIGYVTSFLGYGMTAAQYFRVQMPLFTVAIGISALACFWLVPDRGLIGAAIASIIGLAIQLLLCLGVILNALHKLKRFRHS